MKRTLRTVKAFASESPFTEGQIRWWIFNAETIGLASAIVRIGRRVYIDADQFDAWIDRQNPKPPAPTAR